jgi:hypothetical protein
MTIIRYIINDTVLALKRNLSEYLIYQRSITRYLKAKVIAKVALKYFKALS